MFAAWFCMRHLAQLALAVCLTITTGSVADAGSRQRAAADDDGTEVFERQSRSRASGRARSAQKVARKRARPSRSRDVAKRDEDMRDEDMRDEDENALRDQKRADKRGNKRNADKRRGRDDDKSDDDKSDDGGANDDGIDAKRHAKRSDRRHDKRGDRDEDKVAVDDDIDIDNKRGKKGNTKKRRDRDEGKVAVDDEDAIDGDDSDDSDDDDSDDNESDTDRVAFASRDSNDEGIDDSLDRDEDSDELVDAPKARKRNGFRDWHIAIGPDLWAASVDANVSLGSASVTQGVDFMDITRHTRFGAAAVAEARYRRFSITGDLLYGVIDIAGAKEIGPLMVALDGTATSLLVDGIAGYRVVGKEDSVLWLEARGGIRYQRTAISGQINVSGNAVTPPQQVDAGSDALGGARVFVRPPWMSQRFALSAAFDTRLFGSSSSTWSASADASVRITSYVLLSLGWRTLTQDRAPVATTMHGPRAAVQLLF